MVRPVGVNGNNYGGEQQHGPAAPPSSPNMKILEDNAGLLRGLQSNMGPGFTGFGYPASSSWGQGGGWSSTGPQGPQITGYIENSNQAMELLLETSKGEQKSNRELIDELGNKDGTLSLEEFKNAAYNENLSPTARAAAKFFLQNSGEWRGIADSRGKYNGIVDFTSLDTALLNPNAPIDRVDAANQLKAKFDAIKGLSGNGGERDLGIFKIPDNKQDFIDNADLKAVLADNTGKFDERTKEAARFFINSEHELKKLDVANHGRFLFKADDKISFGDLEEYTKNPDDSAFRQHFFF